MSINLKNLTIKKAHKAMKAGEFSAEDLTEAYLQEIEKKNPELNAYLEVFDDAKEQAREADKRFKDGSATILTGIPMAIKDNILIKGKIASSASKILENYEATYDATVIERLKAEGVVFLGRTNMDEFAMGASNENSAFGPVKNPLDTKRVSGGSSGGSAASVAADLSLVSLGSDTAGSIRQPASFCGVVGLKPTYGAVSRFGLMALTSSLDQIGPVAKTVEDAEIIFNLISGKDPKDSTSQEFEKKETAGKITIGIPADLPKEGVSKEVIKNFEESIKKLQDLGFETKEIKLPDIKYSVACYYVITPAEASTNLARYDGVRYGLHKDGKNLFEDYTETKGVGFGREVRRRILLGTYVLSAGYYDAYYNQAIKAKELVRRDFNRAFEEVDAIVMPTTPDVAFKLGEKVNDPVKMYLEDLYTVPANLAGIPSLSVPSGFAEEEGERLPLGLQIIAPHFREDVCFAVGKKFLSR